MPEAVKIAEVPTFTRTAQVSKYADIFNYVSGLLADEKRRTVEAVKFLEADGVTKENWGQIATGLRNVAKAMGAKLAIVYRDEALWVKHNGDYVAMSAEEIAKRREVRESNKAIKAAQEAKAKGAATK